MPSPNASRRRSSRVRLLASTFTVIDVSALGIARTGGTSANDSGDIFIAFSTANPRAASAMPTADVRMLSNARISAVFDATVYATEEAVVNALFAAETMVGRDDHRVEALPIDRVIEILENQRPRA